MWGLIFVAAGLTTGADVRWESGRLRGEPAGGTLEIVETEDCAASRSGADLRVSPRCEFLAGRYEDVLFALHREREGSHIFLVREP